MPLRARVDREGASGGPEAPRTRNRRPESLLRAGRRRTGTYEAFGVKGGALRFAAWSAGAVCQTSVNESPAGRGRQPAAAVLKSAGFRSSRVPRLGGAPLALAPVAETVGMQPSARVEGKPAGRGAGIFIRADFMREGGGPA